jgi:hypothetical protein
VTVIPVDCDAFETKSVGLCINSGQGPSAGLSRKVDRLRYCVIGILLKGCLHAHNDAVFTVPGIGTDKHPYPMVKPEEALASQGLLPVYGHWVASLLYVKNCERIAGYLNKV